LRKIVSKARKVQKKVVLAIKKHMNKKLKAHKAKKLMKKL